MARKGVSSKGKGVKAVSDIMGNTMQNKGRFPVLALAGYFKAERLVGEACEDLSERYTFTGKELDEESNLYYYDARYNSSTYSQLHNDRCASANEQALCSRLSGHFTTVDPMSDKYPSVNPYLYCAGNPIKYVDPDGKWYVEVHASQNRAKYYYALYQVFDKNHNIIFQTVVKVRGQFRQRNIRYGDTPTGRYKLNKWRNDNDFGTNDFIDQTYLSGEAKSSGRDRMHTHGGGDICDQNGNLYDLKGTNGCIRMADDDIDAMKNITDYLEGCDPSEKMETLTIQDDLKEPITNFRQKRDETIQKNGYSLPEVIVYPNNEKDSK